MRQTREHRARLEQFMADVLGKALADPVWAGKVRSQELIAGGSPNGADARSARVQGVAELVDGRLMAEGFMVLFDDREDHGSRTHLKGVSTRWRDDMIHARMASDASLVSGVDAARVLELSLEDDD